MRPALCTLALHLLSILLRMNLNSFVARLAAVALCLLGALSGCTSTRNLLSTHSVLESITPHKIEIVQGNVVTQEQAAQLKPGMTRAQVRDVLGTALVADVFHADRWDYVFTIRRQGAPEQLRRIVVRFSGDVFKSIDTGGDLPSEREFVASIDTAKTVGTAPVLELTEAQRKALPLPPAPVPVVVETPGALRTYPPLEPAR